MRNNINWPVIIGATIGLALAVHLTPSKAALCDEWETKDTALAVTAGVATAADWGQTLNMVRRQESGDYSRMEMNPLLGPTPTRGAVNRHFLRSVIVTGVLTCTLPVKYRRVLLGGVATIEAAVVIHNRGLGLSISY